jgi:hypothetical protein
VTQPACRRATGRSGVGGELREPATEPAVTWVGVITHMPSLGDGEPRQHGGDLKSTCATDRSDLGCVLGRKESCQLRIQHHVGRAGVGGHNGDDPPM